MAYTSKHDGRKFQNHQEGKHYDEVRASEKKTKSEPADDEERASENPDIHEVVEEHGPAHTSHIEKADDDSYSMKSEHEDGHKHESHGHTLEEAHKHSMMAHGGEDMEPEEEAEEMPEMAHASPPGMPAMG